MNGYELLPEPQPSGKIYKNIRSNKALSTSDNFSNVVQKVLSKSSNFPAQPDIRTDKERIRDKLQRQFQNEVVIIKT